VHVSCSGTSCVVTLLICLIVLQNEADAYRKIRLRAEDVQGRNVLTNFWVSAEWCGGCWVSLWCLPSAARR
jgi:thiol-disulfide isomerase/thioredoxin